jgi:hypothetical protein
MTNAHTAWRFEEGDTLRVAGEGHHNGARGVVLKCLRGYIDDEGNKVDMGGGCYAVRMLRCGCEGLVFEHQVSREGERPCLQ